MRRRLPRAPCRVLITTTHQCERRARLLPGTHWCGHGDVHWTFPSGDPEPNSLTATPYNALHKHCTADTGIREAPGAPGMPGGGGVQTPFASHPTAASITASTAVCAVAT